MSLTQALYTSSSTVSDSWPHAMLNRTEEVNIDSSSSLINYNQPGNRLYVNMRGELCLVSKSPGECIGKYVLAPLIDRISTYIFSPLRNGMNGAWSMVSRSFNYLPALPTFIPQVSAHSPVNPLILENQENSNADALFNAAYQAGEERNWRRLEELEGHKSFTSCEGRSLTWEAIQRRNFSLAEELIDREIALFSVDSNGNTLLHFAARYGNTLLVERLRSSNKVDEKNHDGQTPLHLAVIHGHVHVIDQLIRFGSPIGGVARLNYLGTVYENLTPLHLAIIYDRPRLVNRFFSAGIPENVRHANVPGVGNLLHLAIEVGSNQALESLLYTQHEEMTPFLNSGNEKGMTPLMFAAYRGNCKAIRLLRKKKAHFEAKDLAGRTAVHWAIIGKQRISLDLLNHYECNLESTDGDGKTPLQLLGDVALLPASDEGKGLANYLNNLIIERDQAKDPCIKACYPEGLVFQGGGAKGFAYPGVTASLEDLERLDEILWVAGTSAGAIQSTVMAFNYDASEVKRLMKKDFTAFLYPYNDPVGFLTKKITGATLTQMQSFVSKLQSYYANPTGIVRDGIQALWKTTGACPGEAFREWMEDVIAAKVARVVRETREKHPFLTFGEAREKYAFLTFGELRELIDHGFPFKHLHVVVTNLATGNVEEINSQESKWGRVIISDAVRASMSIPFVFEPHSLHYKDALGNRIKDPSSGVYVDGFLARNFAIDIFDKIRYKPTGVPLGGKENVADVHFVNKRTLGFSLFCESETTSQPPKTVETLGDLTLALSSFYLNIEKSFHNRLEENKGRTIRIDCQGITPLEFGADDARKESLAQSGYKAVEEHFESCSHSTIKAKECERETEPLKLQFWTDRLREANDIEPQAIEWLVVNSFLLPRDIPIGWIDRWFQEKESIQGQNLDLGREENFRSPFNKPLGNRVSSQMRWNQFVDLGFYDYNQVAKTLTLRMPAEIARMIILPDKYQEVRSFVVFFWSALREEHPEEWKKQCDWLIQGDTEYALYRAGVTCSVPS